jgi:hypothetical protein
MTEWSFEPIGLTSLGTTERNVSMKQSETKPIYPFLVDEASGWEPNGKERQLFKRRL